MDSPQQSRATSLNEEEDVNVRVGSRKLVCGRCLHEFITFATFSLVMFAGLSLVTAGIFKEQVNFEESELGKLQLSLNFSAFLGILLLLYSIIGSCLNCLNRLEGKYLIIWSTNITLSLLAFIKVFIGSPDSVVEVNDVPVSEELVADC